MRIELTEAQIERLIGFANRSEDCEQLGEGEYVLDLYDVAVPVTLDLVLEKGGLRVDGAAKMCYDEGMDGWYMGEAIGDPQHVLDALTEAGAL